jgi:hypothetical protein
MEIMGTSFPDTFSENPWASFSVILQVGRGWRTGRLPRSSPGESR